MDNYIFNTIDQNDIDKMSKIGFTSLVIKNNEGNIVGICDFKIED